MASTASRHLSTCLAGCHGYCNPMTHTQHPKYWLNIYCFREGSWALGSGLQVTKVYQPKCLLTHQLEYHVVTVQHALPRLPPAALLPIALTCWIAHRIHYYLIPTHTCCSQSCVPIADFLSFFSAFLSHTCLIACVLICLLTHCSNVCPSVCHFALCSPV
jgi:hypothetical protein